MALSDNQKGVSLMLIATCGFVVTDSIFQYISNKVDVSQYLFLRGIILSLGIFILAKRTGKPFPKDWAIRRKMLARGLTELILAISFLTALKHIPLSVCTATNQTVPLVMTLIAYFFFGEKFGIHRGLAIVMGFIGVMLIIKPGYAELSPYYLLLVVAVLCISTRDFISRFMPKEVPSTWVAFVTVTMVMLANGIITAFSPWKPLSLTTDLTIIFMALLAIFAQVLIVSAMRVGDVSFVSPFRYSAILLAVLIDLFIFRKDLDALTILGCIMVAGAGIYTLMRESKQKALRGV